MKQRKDTFDFRAPGGTAEKGRDLGIVCEDLLTKNVEVAGGLKWIVSKKAGAN